MTPEDAWPARAPLRFTLARAAALVAVLATVTLLAFALSARFGEQSISLRTAFAEPTSTDAAIFWSLRLPRALCCPSRTSTAQSEASKTASGGI